MLCPFLELKKKSGEWWWQWNDLPSVPLHRWYHALKLRFLGPQAVLLNGKTLDGGRFSGLLSHPAEGLCFPQAHQPQGQHVELLELGARHVLGDASAMTLRWSQRAKRTDG